MEQFSGAAWRTSSHSGSQGDCVEVAHTADTVGVRDTKNRPGGQLSMSNETWDLLLADLKAATAG